MPKVSVIIPIYGVEKYIQRCAESLMRQTLDDIEFLFVNDCTLDNSITLLQETLSGYPWRKYEIIHHDVNKGLPAARNTGLACATGEYIYHCDSDDYLEYDALEVMFNAAREHDADIVWCDFYEEYSNRQIYQSQPNYCDSDSAIRAMMTSGMRFNVWNKLCRRSIFIEHDVRFLEGNSMGEDMSMMKLFLHANTVAHVSKALYHYVRFNPGALTKNHTQKRIQEDKNNINSLLEYYEQHNGAEYKDYIGFHTLWTKLPLILTSGNQGQYKEWADWSPEYNTLISRLPNANRRLRLLMNMASKKQWWFVRLHYWVVVCLYYSIRYSHTL